VTPTRSLRLRLIVGSLLWTIGLLATASLVTTALHHGSLHLAIAHGTMMFLLAVACMIAGLAQLRSGLLPFEALRARLLAVRVGRQRRVDGRYPVEVQPLVDDLNALLEHRERAVGRAIAKAGDLAHGLKTPLAVLAQDADRAEAAGLADLSASIGQQVERMRRQIDYHLAHARAAASGAAPGARCLVSESADGLARTLSRLHAGRGVTIDVRVAPGHAVRCEREDLDEMLGNLLDNACKWARSRVTLATAEDGPDMVITIDDDGPGIAAPLREAVLQRGVRADQAAPGSGLGLAIVRDLVELYGGSIALEEATGGGLRARLRLSAG
jgi:signal transduction histidine kinase